MTDVASSQASRSAESVDRKGKFRTVGIELPNNLDRALDHALEETFPASDPISIAISKIVRRT